MINQDNEWIFERLVKVQEQLHECSAKEYSMQVQLRSSEYTIEILNAQLIEAYIERIQLLEIINKLRNNE